MKLKEIKIEKGFEDLFSFTTEEDELRHMASTIMFKFISELERITCGKITKKKWSEIIGTTPSYVTQLFNGDKLMNLLTMAKIEKALFLEIDFKLISTEKTTSNFTEFTILSSSNGRHQTNLSLNNQNIRSPQESTSIHGFESYSYSNDHVDNYDTTMKKFQETSEKTA